MVLNDPCLLTPPSEYDLVVVETVFCFVFCFLFVSSYMKVFEIILEIVNFIIWKVFEDSELKYLIFVSYLLLVLLFLTPCVYFFIACFCSFNLQYSLVTFFYFYLSIQNLAADYNPRLDSITSHISNRESCGIGQYYKCFYLNFECYCLLLLFRHGLWANS